MSGGASAPTHASTRQHLSASADRPLGAADPRADPRAGPAVAMLAGGGAFNGALRSMLARCGGMLSWRGGKGWGRWKADEAYISGHGIGLRDRLRDRLRVEGLRFVGAERACELWARGLDAGGARLRPRCPLSITRTSVTSSNAWMTPSTE